MKRSVRLLDLVHLLSGPRTRSIAEIAGRFDVSVRTAYRDLAELEEQRIPVVHDERGYRLMETATLRPLNLTAGEHALLKVALRNPSLQRRSSLRPVLDSLEAKLDAASRRVEESPEALRLAGLDRSGEGTERSIAKLERAVAQRRTLRMSYRSLSGSSPESRRLDPWVVFEREGAWYAVGHCHRHRAQRMFRLDRIEKLEVLEEVFERPQGFSIESYLESSWRLIQGDEQHEVVLLFEAQLGPLLLTSRHHPDEEVERRPDGTIEYRVRLSSLEEIARWVLGFGGLARVVAPDELGDRVEALARQVLEAGSKTSPP